jgi:hypothetical protein
VKLTWFRLGANVAGETSPGYFKSGTCGINTPTSQGGANFIDVEGTY